LRASGGLINLASRKLLYFGGQRDVTIAPGADVFSDPAPYDLPPQTDLAVSIYAKAAAAESTLHVVQRNAIYVMDGDVEGAAANDDVTQVQPTGQAWIWLDEVEVAASPARGAVVAFGDSITDGVGPPADTRTTWPDVLFQRLSDAGLQLSVINAGIGGNRLLHAGAWGPFGVPGLARFDADVLDQPGVRAVIVFMGINDIGQVGQSAPTAEYASAADIEAGLSQLAQRAHGRGLKVYVGTLTPFKVSIIKGYYSDDKELERQAVNAWIRTNTGFDGVVDFDRAVSDPDRPGQILPLYDSSDHLHPSAAGDAALAAAIPLDWFK
jgi:lysophospholipase L1-like esterase